MSTEKKGLHDDLLRGSKSLNHGKLPQGRFEETEDLLKVESLRHGPGKLFLGLLDAEIDQTRNEKTKRLSRHATGGTAIGMDDDRHIITVAGSRAGKGVSAIVPNLLSYTGSILAIDPKAELATMTARCREDVLGQKVYVLDPFKKAKGRGAERRCSFNPMDLTKLGSDTIVEDAGLLADALVVPSGGDSHWDESAKNLIEGAILHVATYQKYRGKRNLITVYKLLASSLTELLEEMVANGNAYGCDGAVKEAAINVIEKTDKERDSILSTVRRQLRFLGYKHMQSVLQESDFKLEELKKEKVTIYLCLPAMRLGICFRWFRLFINMVLARMETGGAKPETPVLLCLDEFAILGHMKTLEDAAGQIAGFGCRLWPILQDLGQLKAIYKDRWETFMGNAGVLQFFGNSDMTTLDWISSRLGETAVKQVSKNDIGYLERAASDATGESQSMQSHPLMTSEEISRYFSREDKKQRQLVIRTGFLPMILQRVAYYKDDRFAGKWDTEEGTTPED